MQNKGAVRAALYKSGLFGFARSSYVQYVRLKESLIDSWVRLSSSKTKNRTFRLGPWVMTEAPQHHWKATYLANGLREYKNIVAQTACWLSSQEAPVLFDVGANWGVYSYLWSQIRGSRIYSFEPVPQNFECLQSNVLNNNLSNVKVFNLGLSNSSYTAEMINPCDGVDGNMGHFKLPVDKNETKSKHKIVASFDSLDNIVSEQNIDRLNYLKIDVEMHEESVLEGGVLAIEKFRPIVQLEVFREAGRAKKNFAFFSERDYVVAGWNGYTVEPVTQEKWLEDKRFDPDLFMFPRELADNVMKEP